MKTEVTPIHIPRVNGLAHAEAESQHSFPALPGTTPSAVDQSVSILVPKRRIKPFASLRAHKWLALGVTASIFIIGAPTAWMLGRPAFYTEAVVRVSPRFGK